MAEHSKEIYDTDSHFVIDDDTRLIKSNSQSKVKLVKGDNNSQRFTFELTRYIDGHDMSESEFVTIHYLNSGIDGSVYKGIYEVDDLMVKENDESMITFTWLVSNLATQYSGTLNFAIRFSCDESKYVWNTAILSGLKIVDTVYNSEDVVIENVDILEQWREELFGISGEVSNAVERAEAAADKAESVFPEGGQPGQIPTKTENGIEWKFPQGGGTGIVSPDLDTIKVLDQDSYDKLPLEEKQNKRTMFVILG